MSEPLKRKHQSSVQPQLKRTKSLQTTSSSQQEMVACDSDDHQVAHATVNEDVAPFLDESKATTTTAAANPAANPRTLVIKNTGKETVVYGNTTTIVGPYYNVAGDLKIISERVPEQLVKQFATETDDEQNQAALVKSIADDLREHYMQTYCRKQMYPWKPGNFVDLENVYVPVTIDEQIPGMRPIKRRLKSYQEIFHTDQPGVKIGTRHILTGAPGQGKSTFCSKLAYDWCHKTDESPLKDIDLLFILQLGTLNNKTKIEDAICSQLLSTSLDEVDGAILCKLFKKRRKSLVLVLDSLDEASVDLLTSIDNDNLVDLISFKHLRECRVLVTTRPWRESEITTRFPVYRRLELQKMSRADVKAYVEKLFGQNPNDLTSIGLGKRLLKYIDENKVLVDTSTPLMVLLISWYWNETGGRKRIPNRIGELYEEIFTLLYCSLQNPIISKETLVNQLGEMAIEGLTTKQTKIVFTIEDVKAVCGDQGLQQALDMGILDRKGSNAVQFFHKTGQEYCAGYYLRSNIKRLDSYLQDVRTVKDALSVAPVLTFASSSKPAAAAIVQKLVQNFSAEVQVSEYYNESLPFDKTRLIQAFTQMCLECNFEANAQSELTSILKDLFQGGRVLFYGISSKSAISLAHFMTYCNYDAIQHLTLRPIAHASEALTFTGPNSEMYYNALKVIKDLPENRVQQLFEKFIASEKDLHDDWTQRFYPAELMAFMECFQAYEGLTCSSEANIVPIIHSLKHTKLQSLNVNYVRLGNEFDHLIESAKNGDLQTLLSLEVRSTVSTGQQLTRLVSILHMMSALRVLDISRNKVEEGQTFPTLAANLAHCPALHELNVGDMDAPAEDMEMLAQKLPSSLTSLDISNSGMNDVVASHLAETLPRTLTSLEISIRWHSASVILRLFPSKLTRLKRLSIWNHEEHPEDLLEFAGQALTTCTHLDCLKLQSTSDDKEEIPVNCVEMLVEGMHHARNITELYLYGIKLCNKGFHTLLSVCRQKSLQQLRYDRVLLPEGVSPEDLEDFVVLS